MDEILRGLISRLPKSPTSLDKATVDKIHRYMLQYGMMVKMSIRFCLQVKVFIFISVTMESNKL